MNTRILMTIALLVFITLIVTDNEVLAVEASNKLATTWGTLKSVR